MFFDGFSEDDMVKLERMGTLRRYKEDDALLKEGEGGTSFAIILKGSAEVRKQISGDKYKVLVELRAFDIIGELGFFDTPGRTASVIALEKTEVLEFSRKNFDLFTESNVDIGYKLYKNMANILAGRLASNDSTLMDTIVWALGQPRDSAANPDDTIRETRKLKILRG